MINSFAEIPLFDFSEILLMSFVFSAIGFFVLFLGGVFISVLLSKGEAFETIINYIIENIKLSVLIFMVLVTTLFWLLLNVEITENQYSNLSKAVSSKNSFPLGQQLYKLAVSDKKIKNYEHVIINYNIKRLKEEATEHASELKKTSQIEKTLKSIDTVKP